MARRTKEEAEATRNRLLDAAETVFYARGVSGASLADVAQAAGVTRGAIYWHFKDKVDLFDAMMARVTSPLEQALSALSSTDSGHALHAIQVLRLALRGVATDGRMQRVFAIALFKMEHVGDFAAVRLHRMEGVRRFLHALEAQLLCVQSHYGCSWPISAAEAAQGLFGVFEGLLQLWLLQEGSFDLEAQGMRSMQIYLRGLGVPHELIEKI